MGPNINSTYGACHFILQENGDYQSDYLEHTEWETTPESCIRQRSISDDLLEGDFLNSWREVEEGSVVIYTDVPLMIRRVNDTSIYDFNWERILDEQGELLPYSYQGRGYLLDNVIIKKENEGLESAKVIIVSYWKVDS